MGAILDFRILTKLQKSAGIEQNVMKTKKGTHIHELKKHTSYSKKSNFFSFFHFLQNLPVKNCH